MQFTLVRAWFQSQTPCCLCNGKIKRTSSYTNPLICRICNTTLSILPCGLDITENSVAEQLVCRNVDGIAVIGIYQWPLSAWLTKLKFNQQLHFSRLIGYLLARQVEQQNWPKIELVCALPLHYRRWVIRGFNQSQVILSEFLREIDIPIYNGLLRRRHTKAQSTQNRANRLSNLDEAFVATIPIHGKTILLIDDVLTTGATLKAATMALKNAGATRVYAACGAIRLVS